MPQPTRALLDSITSWLASNFDLPAAPELPRIEFLPREVLDAKRARGLVSGQEAHLGSGLSFDQEGSTVAVYDGTLRTIYLAEKWSGETPAEVSVLVHEIVHHLQHAAGMVFECPQAKEKTAYEAQERWLGLSARSLLQDFEIDPLTLLLRTSCLY
jgi:hypothetical protein